MSLWRIVSVYAFFPQFVQSCTSNNQSGIEFKTIRSECGILEEFSGCERRVMRRLESEDVTFVAHVGKIGHHVGDYLEAAVLKNVSTVMCMCMCMCM